MSTTPTPSPPKTQIHRYWQTLIWIGVVTVAKFGLFFFLLAASDRFGAWGHFLFSPLCVFRADDFFSRKQDPLTRPDRLSLTPDIHTHNPHRKNHPQVELVIVMVLMPGALNVVQFWVLDNLLKSNAAETPTAPLSPSKGVRAAPCFCLTF